MQQLRTKGYINTERRGGDGFWRGRQWHRDVESWDFVTRWERWGKW